MAIFAYTTAPWSVGTIVRQLRGDGRPSSRHLFVAAVIWLCSVSWPYNLYLLWRDGMYPIFHRLVAVKTHELRCGGQAWNCESREPRDGRVINRESLTIKRPKGEDDASRGTGSHEDLKRPPDLSRADVRYQDNSTVCEGDTMDDWLVEYVREEHDREAEPEEGKGTILQHSATDGVGLLELDSGRVISFGFLRDGADPEPGVEVYAEEMCWRPPYGWAAGHVETLESYQTPDPDSESDLPHLPDAPPPPEEPRALGSSTASPYRDQYEQIPEDLRVPLDPAPAVFLVLDRDLDDRNTHYGGNPLVPPGASWPAADGEPMAFMGQLDFAELDEAHRGTLPLVPDQGILTLFFDMPTSYGGGPQTFDGSAHFVPNAEVGTRLSPPTDDATWERAPLRPVTGLTPRRTDLPHPRERHPDYRGPEFEDRWWETVEDLRMRRYHQVGGHPDWIQFEDRWLCEFARRNLDPWDAETRTTPEAAAAMQEIWNWNLLWSIESDRRIGDEFQFFDAGMLYFMIRDDDLAERNFQAGELIMQAH